ncbi:MAG: hypothetical protein JOZ32_00755 [Bryobacterales bacterium]|nr:hypothetical protein [Bryobacterales bacterium]
MHLLPVYRAPSAQKIAPSPRVGAISRGLVVNNDNRCMMVAAVMMTTMMNHYHFLGRR